MLVVVSPAKRLNEKLEQSGGGSVPQFSDTANDLVEYARKLNVAKLQKLMALSKNLAELSVTRFANFAADPKVETARKAALYFAGDTYLGLEAHSLSDEDMNWAQDHFRILSGLYGVLRPNDLIQAYRLEMGSRLVTKKGKNLYDYWGDRLAVALNETAEKLGADTLVNCASVEYFGAVDLKALKLRVITPVFMEEKAGTPKIVSFFAKKARGAMARFIIENRVINPEGLKDFDTGGYRYNAEMSEGDKWVFLRDYPEGK